MMTQLRFFNGFKIGLALEDRLEIIEIKKNDEGIKEGTNIANFHGLHIYFACFELSFTNAYMP